MVIPAPARPSRYAWLSIAAALATMALKAWAWLLTGSVGLFADALESLVNLAAGVMALLVLRVAERPPDEEHLYGHEKAEYFASGAEGTLILVAAVSIAASAGRRLLVPRPVEQLDVGLAILVAAAAVNLVTALYLLAAGRRLRSISLRANAHHLLTDVWTSAGVLAGLALVALTGWQAADPLVALVLAGHVGWTGFRLVSASTHGLMDRALPGGEVRQVTAALDGLLARQEDEVRYHALRTRRSGARSFVSFHVQVPGRWSVQRGHDLVEAMEEEIRRRLPAATVFTHLEPLEDPRSYRDQVLDPLR
jgi:cation diffusion facilitator family transporter